MSTWFYNSFEDSNCIGSPIQIRSTLKKRNCIDSPIKIRSTLKKRKLSKIESFLFNSPIKYITTKRVSSSQPSTIKMKNFQKKNGKCFFFNELLRQCWSNFLGKSALYFAFF